MTSEAPSGSNPYATGGGGVVLEHHYAGSVLTALLLGHPVDGLGEECLPVEVGFQLGSESPVDDLGVRGEHAGGERMLHVASRRRPVLGASSEPTVKLFLDYLRVVLAEPEALAAGQLRLGLAVAGPYGPAAQLAELTEIARPHETNEDFRPQVYSTPLRDRLANVDQLVEAALRMPGAPDPNGLTVEELSWRLLAGLYVIQHQLEGDVAPSRTQLVARLQAIAGDVTTADRLRRRLNDLASTYATRAGGVTQAVLRRDLRSFGKLGAAPAFEIVRGAFDLLEQELRRKTHTSLLPPGGPSVTLDRSQLQRALQEAISQVPGGAVVLVRGEPDVGKSALSLGAIDAIRSDGDVALALSIRDLPSSVLALRDQLGVTPASLLATAPSAPASVLLLDGGETVQEGQGDSLGALVAAATAVGMTPVVVVRDDAAGTVRELLSHDHGEPVEFVVSALADAEMTTLTESIPTLKPLAANPRSRWLLRRLGLVELLLRAIARGADLPVSLSSEAEVFATTWFSFIRNNERTVDGVAPDDRQAAAAAVAYRLLTGQHRDGVPGPALATLRADGVLSSRDKAAVWSASDRFASDVLRDYATAHLLLAEGLRVLVTSTAPRWAIRATRLFCQVRLSEAAQGPPGSLATAWNELRNQVAELVARHGARWGELPWEALLTGGWACQALAELTEHLVGDEKLRDEAIRCLRLRFTDAGACDPLIGAPMVDWLISHAPDLGESRGGRDNPADELTVSWLRGVGRRELKDAEVTEHRGLRVRVRDLVLRRCPTRRDPVLLDCLALLGSDSNDASVDLLRGVARDAPGFLAPVVESMDVAVLLAARDPGLLADLAESYYIEKPSEGRRYGAIHDDGIRRHRGGGLRDPMAAWYRGPFFPLLRADLRRGLALINRMLDHAVRRSVATLARSRRSRGTEVSEQDPVQLDLLGLGARSYIGDSYVWAWYRGSAMGPYPCVSALVSLEVVIDELVARMGVPVRTVATILLKDATTLATPGLVFGFLTRHLEAVSDELDGFLADPNVWELEFGRAAVEGSVHVQGPDPADLTGRDRRRWTPREVASNLVIAAVNQGNAAAVDRLAAVGGRLVESAGGEQAPPQVRQWAAHLDWNTYSAHRDGGNIVLQVTVPDEVAQALAPSQTYSDQIAEMYRLQNRYRARSVTPYQPALAKAPTEKELGRDIQVALRLPDELPGEPLDLVRTAVAGVAAAVLNVPIGQPVDASTVTWAINALVDSARSPYLDRFASPESIFPNGADRQAALALPHALHVAVGPGDASRETDDDLVAQIGAALEAITTSPSDEVRLYGAEGLRRLWQQPCQTLDTARCHHKIGWQAVEAGTRNVALGPYDEDAQQRPRQTLAGDIPAVLNGWPDEDLMLPSIASAAISVLEAAASTCCVRDEAERFLPAVLSAYIRAARHWSSNDYDWRSERHAAFAAAMLRYAGHQDASPLVEVAQELASGTDALAQFLDALTLAATYDHTLVAPLGRAWPELMAIGLTAATQPGADPFGYEHLIQNLVPDPTVIPWEDDIDATLQSARAHWLDIGHVAEHIDEWLSHAKHERWCIDTLVGFLKAQPIDQQVDLGLPWVHALVVREDGTARAGGFLLVSWLEAARNCGLLDNSATARATYRAIVDALVLGDYTGARALQQRDE
jgi:hypothetical protein